MQLTTCTEKRWITATAVLASALQIWLLYLYSFPSRKVLWGDEVFYLDSARLLLAGNPRWHLEPLWPTLYSHFLAGLGAIGGPRPLVLVQMAQITLLVISVIVLGDFTRRVTGSETAGRAAATLMLLYPPLVAFSHYLWPEVLHLFFLTALSWILLVHRRSLWWAVVAGVLLGLAVLTKSLLMPIAPLVLVVFAAQRPLRRAIWTGGVFALALALTVVPTVVSNQQRHGVAMIANSGPFNLWVGLNDKARRNFDEPVVNDAYLRFKASGATFSERNEWVTTEIRHQVGEQGILATVQAQLGRQYFRFFDKDSFLTSQLPPGPITAWKRGYLDRPPPLALPTRYVSYTAYALLLIAAPMGWFLWPFARPQGLRLWAGFFAYVLALALFLHVKSRYRLQILPFFFIGSGAAVAWLEHVLNGGDGSPINRRSVAAACIVSLLLLVLAFAGPLL